MKLRLQPHRRSESLGSTAVGATSTTTRSGRPLAPKQSRCWRSSGHLVAGSETTHKANNKSVAAVSAVRGSPLPPSRSFSSAADPSSPQELPPTPAESFTDDDPISVVGPIVDYDEDADLPPSSDNTTSNSNNTSSIVGSAPHTRSLGVGTFQQDEIVLSSESPTATPSAVLNRLPSISEASETTHSNVMRNYKSSGATAIVVAPIASVVSSSEGDDSDSSTSESNNSRYMHLHYLRISDLLTMDESLHSSYTTDDATTTTASSSLTSKLHRTPHPSCDCDPHDSWVWLGCPVTQPLAVEALVNTGWNMTMNTQLWTLSSPNPTSILQQPRYKEWHDSTFPTNLATTAPTSSPLAHELPVLVWTGKLHGLHRSDLPAVRAAAVLDATPEALLELLIDSNRVQEYNPHSLGRHDLHVLQSTLRKNDSDDGSYEGMVTKVMRSSTKPPLVRKTLVFTSLLHARAIDNGYLIVTRSVSTPEAVSSEILLSVTVLLKHPPIMSSSSRTTTCSTRIVTVNHIHSPLIPLMLAKRIGVQAAASFLNDLKKCLVPA